VAMAPPQKTTRRRQSSGAVQRRKEVNRLMPPDFATPGSVPLDGGRTRRENVGP
jgi:hypothetical protein